MTSDPAFPTQRNGFNRVEDGMTLRDWFAGQALGGLIVGYKCPLSCWDAVVKEAYIYADAMIVQRT